jgi:hypothetical protein
MTLQSLIYEALPYVKNSLQHNQFLEGGAVLGALAVIGSGLKTAALFLWDRASRVVTYRASFQDGTFTYNAVSYMIETKYRDKLRSVEVQSRRSRWGRRNQPVPADDSFIIWIGLVPIVITSSTQILEMVKDGSPFHRTITLQTIFFKETMHRLIDQAADDWIAACDADDEGQIWVNQDNSWRTAGRVANRSIKSVIGESTSIVYHDLREFIESAAWYKNKGLKYKRGYLFWGPPGTGKTSLCNALASEFGLDLCILNLANLTDDNAVYVMSELGETGRRQKPKILLIEDLDSYLEGRVVKKKNLRFSTLLNVFDGIMSCEGIILIMTTNLIDSLDPALVRPGRIDRILHIDYPTSADVTRYLELFYETQLDDVGVAGLSMSKVQECCIQHKQSLESCIQQLKRDHGKD